MAWGEKYIIWSRGTVFDFWIDFDMFAVNGLRFVTIKFYLDTLRTASLIKFYLKNIKNISQLLLVLFSIELIIFWSKFYLNNVKIWFQSKSKLKIFLINFWLKNQIKQGYLSIANTEINSINFSYFLHDISIQCYSGSYMFFFAQIFLLNSPFEIS